MTDVRRGRDGPQGPDGRQGQDGREGVSGPIGATGESTMGEKGERGREGNPGRAGPLGIGLALVLLGCMTFLGWQGEHHACIRSNTTRHAVRIFAQTAFEARSAAAQLDRERGDKQAYAVDHGAAIKYAASIRTAAALSCDRLFPEAK